MKRQRFLAIVAVCGLVAWLAGCTESQKTPTTRPGLSKAESRAISVIESIQPSLVKVEYTFHYDKGEIWPNAAETMSEERPFEMCGFVIAPNRVVCGDSEVHPRFVKSITVRCGDQVTPARCVALGIEQHAIILETDEPLKDAKPLEFKGKDAFMGIAYDQHGAEWTTAMSGIGISVQITESGRKYMLSQGNVLIVDKNGDPVAISMRSKLPLDGSWKTSPDQWPMITTQERDDLLNKLAERANSTVVRVQLSLRSPKSKSTDRYRGYGRYGEESDTERSVLGVVDEAGRVIVLTELSPSDTARIERITVHPDKGQPIQAKFVASLRHYGCLIAALPKPIEGAVPWHSGDIADLEDQLLPLAQVRLLGETKINYYNHCRLENFQIGWRGQVFPSRYSLDGTSFIFDRNGSLVAVPLSMRQRATTEHSYRGYGGQELAVPMTYLKAAMADLKNEADPANVPLTEENESRIAWLGVELQSLNPQLARANGVADLTQDGQTGALVSYVYPNSPAAHAGIVTGDVLLRFHFEDHPEPMPVRVDDYQFSDRAFPWEYYDQLTEDNFDDVPRPWPPVETSLTRALTDMGIGWPFKAEVFHDGKTVFLPMKVEESLAHFDAAPKLESEALGMTVRDMTYEVRRYFQSKDSDPGVIIASIEPKSKASLAQLKPYEYITHVNGQPVKNVEEFGRMIAGERDLKLSVKRWTKGRVVPITLPADTGPATTRPAAAD